MTKFQFTLRRVLEFRRLRADLARAALDRLHVERRQLFAQERSLHVLREDEETAVRVPGQSLTITRLDALDYLQHYVTSAGRRLREAHTQLNLRIGQQQAAVQEADRQVGLLEKLEGRQQADWQVRFSRELEELAADSYMSRLSRKRTL